MIGSQDLKNQGKTIFWENLEEYSKLLDYNIAVEEQVFWTRSMFIINIKELLTRF